MAHSTSMVSTLIAGSKSKSFRRLNAHLYPNAAEPALPAESPSKRIRQREGDGMNKIERAFLEHRRAQAGAMASIHREVSLPIANGVRYKLDFLEANYANGLTITGWEVKGRHVWDDAVVKLKVAASAYPWIRFRLVWMDRGAWQFQDIRP